MRDLLTSGLTFCLGFILLYLVYILAHNGTISYSLFWVSLFLCASATLFVILSSNTGRESKIIFLFVFGLALYSTWVLRSPEFFVSRDEMLHFQATTLIKEKGSLETITTASPLGQWYPGLEIVTTFLTVITNLSIISGGRMLIALVHSLSLVFLYLFFENLGSSPKLAALATLLYTANSRFVFFNSIFSYESLGLGFVTLLLLLISKIRTPQLVDKSFTFLSIITVVALTITHHLTSYMFLLFVITLAFLSFFIGKREVSFSNFASLTGSIMFTWLIYIATPSIGYLNLLGVRLISIFELTLFSGKGERELFVSTQLPQYEVFIKYLYPPLLLLLTLSGVYLFLNDKNSKSIFNYALTICALIYLASWPLVLTSGVELAFRSWTFLFIGVVPFMASTCFKLFIHKNILIKIASTFAIFTLLFGGISLGIGADQRFPLPPVTATGTASYTADVFAATSWFEKQFGRYNKIIGNIIIDDVFGNCGIQNVRANDAWKLFFPRMISDETLSEFRGYDYIVVDERMSKLLATVKSYFWDDTSNLDNYPPYGLVQPLPEESLDKFNHSPQFLRIYESGNIIIYRWMY